MSDQFTDEVELQKLMTGEAEVEEPDKIDKRAAKAPDPTPEVVERAKALYDRHGNGEAITQVSDQPAEPAEPELDNRTKSQFLAHVLGGVPFTRRYQAFNDRLQAEFSTLSSSDETRISELLLSRFTAPSVSRELQREGYRQFGFVMALTSLTLDGRKAVLPDLRTARDVELALRDYDTWMAAMPGATYRLLYQWYGAFRQQINELLRRAEDKSFWPTP